MDSHSFSCIYLSTVHFSVSKGYSPVQIIYSTWACWRLVLNPFLIFPTHLGVSALPCATSASLVLSTGSWFTLGTGRMFSRYPPWNTIWDILFHLSGTCQSSASCWGSFQSSEYNSARLCVLRCPTLSCKRVLCILSWIPSLAATTSGF